jgi:hypothetical protein
VSAATDAFTALVVALDEVRPECRDDPRFIADDTRPSDLEPICGRCDVFERCEAYAQLAKPKAGIWAGRRWTGRKP